MQRIERDDGVFADAQFGERALRSRISLDFSAMSTWASRRAVSVANAHNI
jgi:hypothetical protein